MRKAHFPPPFMRKHMAWSKQALSFPFLTAIGSLPCSVCSSMKNASARLPTCICDCHPSHLCTESTEASSPLPTEGLSTNFQNRSFRLRLPLKDLSVTPFIIKVFDRLIWILIDWYKFSGFATHRSHFTNGPNPVTIWQMEKETWDSRLLCS